MRKSIATNAIGAGGGQAILLLATPFLARSYSPADFGIYAATAAAASVLSTVFSLRFDAAIPAADQKDIRPLFHGALAVTACLSAVALCASFLSGQSVAGMLVSSVAPVVATALAGLIASTNVYQAVFTREGFFTRIAILKFLQPLAFTAIALAGLTQLHAALAWSWFLVLVVCAYWGHAFHREFEPAKAWHAMKVRREFPLVSTPTALLDAASTALPLLFVASTFGDAAAGNFSQAQRLLSSPLLLLGIASSSVYIKYAGDLMRNQAPVTRLTRQFMASFLGMGIALGLLVYLIGQPLMNLLLGAGWKTDTGFLLLSIAPVVFRMVVSPVSGIFILSNQQVQLSVWQFGYFAGACGIIAVSNDVTLETYLVRLAFFEFAAYLVYGWLAYTAAGQASQRGRA
jgi:O-antigen/teichoic acid export membrane protein